MRERLFNFIPAYQATPKEIQSTERFVTVQKQNNKLSFSSRDPESIALIGKYLYFFVDTQKNILSWKVFSEGELSDLKHVVQVKRYDTTENGFTITASIAVPLKTLVLKENTYKKLKVNTYTSSALLEDRKPYYYISIPTKKSSLFDNDKFEEIERN